MTVFLTLEDLVALCDDLGIGPIRDIGLLDSAAHRPRTSLYGIEAYASLDAQAAALLESIVRNHALVDGNERLGWLSVVVFYGLNGVDLEVPDDEAYDLVVGVASSSISLEEITHTLSAWRAVDP